MLPDPLDPDPRAIQAGLLSAEGEMGDTFKGATGDVEYHVSSTVCLQAQTHSVLNRPLQEPKQPD